MMEAIKNAGIRAVRTFAQTFLAVFIPTIVGVSTFAGLTAVTAIEAAAVAGVIAVLQNWLEQLGGASYNRG